MSSDSRSVDSLLESLPGSERAICRRAARLAERGNKEAARDLLETARQRSDSPKLERALEVLRNEETSALPSRSESNASSQPPRSSGTKVEEATVLDPEDVEIVDGETSTDGGSAGPSGEQDNPFAENEPTVIELEDNDVSYTSPKSNPFDENERTEIWDDEPPEPSDKNRHPDRSDPQPSSGRDSIPPGGDPGAFDADEPTELWNDAGPSDRPGSADSTGHGDPADDSPRGSEVPPGANPAAFDEDEPTELYDSDADPADVPGDNGSAGAPHSGPDNPVDAGRPSVDPDSDRPAGSAGPVAGPSSGDRQPARPVESRGGARDSRRAQASRASTARPGSRNAPEAVDGRRNQSDDPEADSETPESLWRRSVDRLRAGASRHDLTTWASVAGGVLLLAVVLGTVLTFRHSSHLSDELAAVQRLQKTDTYGSYTRALRRLERNESAASPGPWTVTMETLGFLAPGRPPASLRRELADESTHIRSYLEYRFETPGSRLESPGELDLSTSVTSTDVAAAVWRALARVDYRRADTLLDEASVEADTSQRLVDARLATLVERGRSDAAADLAEKLDRSAGLQDHSARRLYLLARALGPRDSESAHAKLEYLLSNKSPSHLDASIEQIRLWLNRGAHARAEAEAERLLDRLDKAAPYQKARIKIMLGRTYASRGSPERAEDQFREALEHAGGRIDVHFPLVDLYLRQGQTGPAADQLDGLSAPDPDFHGIRLRRGELAILRGRYERAGELLSTGHERGARAGFRYGQVLVLTGTYDRASEVLPTDTDSTDWKPAAQIWNILARLKRDDASVEALHDTVSRTMSRHRDDPLVLEGAARIRLTLADRAAGDDENAQERHLKKARRHLQRILENRPDNAGARYLLCRVELQRRAFESARSACRRARRDQRDHLPGVATLTRLQLEQHDPEEALSTLESAREKHPENWQLDRLEIEALVESRRPGEARDLMDEWIARGISETPHTHWLEGRIAYGSGDFETAVGYLKRARRPRSRFSVPADLLRARALARLGREAQAERITRRHLDAPNHEALAWLAFAEVRRHQNRYRDAAENIAVAQRAVDRHSDPTLAADIEVERARIRAARRGWGDYRVDDIVERAQDYDADSPSVRHALGQLNLYGRKGSGRRAVGHLEAALEMRPDHCAIIEDLSEAYTRTGDSEGVTDLRPRRRKQCGR